MLTGHQWRGVGGRGEGMSCHPGGGRRGEEGGRGGEGEGIPLIRIFTSECCHKNVM